MDDDDEELWLLESHPPVNTLHINAALLTLAGVVVKARPPAAAAAPPAAGAGRHLLTHQIPSFATGVSSGADSGGGDGGASARAAAAALAETIRVNLSDAGNVSALLNASALEAGGPLSIHTHTHTPQLGLHKLSSVLSFNNAMNSKRQARV